MKVCMIRIYTSKWIYCSLKFSMSINLEKFLFQEIRIANHDQIFKYSEDKSLVEITPENWKWIVLSDDCVKKYMFL